ncbi:MAG: nucleoid-structuring protein H-NS [Lachnospiraceae bacterium]|jgi:4-hydroxy 2-oxovalerate aldolase|nr:nucleoid-structuring protein H-NS [Lachnospiraceae bacterium]
MCDKIAIQIVDATLRDGGLVNDFYFEDALVKALYETNLRTGVNYMEFGYKASKRMFDPAKNGKWKYCDDEDMRAIVGENRTNMKIAVMADVGRCDFHEDIRPKKESPIDMIRVATYLETIPGAVEMIEDAANKGYEVSCNLMAISKAKESDLREALTTLAKTPASVLYVVDSYGALYPDHAKRLVTTFLDVADQYGKKVGMHAHNNMQLAFSNTMLAHELGATWLDGTYDSMGRGAGNCAMELLLGYLEKQGFSQYHMEQALPFIDQYMEGLKRQGVVWGYDIQYLLTGLLNQHPRAAIRYTKEGCSDHEAFFNEIKVGKAEH